MSERCPTKVDVNVCVIGQAEDDLINIFHPSNIFHLSESQKRTFRDFMFRFYAVPLSVLADYGRRTYSAIRDSIQLEILLGDGIQAIVYCINELVNGLRKISIWAVDIKPVSC